MRRSTTLKPGRRLLPQLNAIFNAMRPEMLKQHTSVAGFTFALGNEKVDSPNPKSAVLNVIHLTLRETSSKHLPRTLSDLKLRTSHHQHLNSRKDQFESN
jgi:hypothetical protein